MIAAENLRAIPWSQIPVASGKADHVPQALAGLVSPDKRLRERSYWQLDNEIVLQSDLYDAAYFVIPFLIQYLRERVPHGRDRIYDLLIEIGRGFAPPTSLCRTTEGDSVPLQDACAREILKGFRVFLRDAGDPDPRVAAKARELMQLLAARSENQGDPGVDILGSHLIELAREFVDLIEAKVGQSGADPDQVRVHPSRNGAIVVEWKDLTHENNVVMNPDGSISFNHRNRQTGQIESRNFSPDEFRHRFSYFRAPTAGDRPSTRTLSRAGKSGHPLKYKRRGPDFKAPVGGRTELSLEYAEC